VTAIFWLKLNFEITFEEGAPKAHENLAQEPVGFETNLSGILVRLIEKPPAFFRLAPQSTGGARYHSLKRSPRI
jgi:hypothetical protein